MNPLPRYFFLVAGAPDATPLKFWTKEEAINYIADNLYVAKNAQFLEITSDSGQLIYSQDEILALVGSQRSIKTLLPVIFLLFMASIFAPAPLDRYLLYGFVVFFIPLWFICGRGVIAFNRSLIRRFRRK